MSIDCRTEVGLITRQMPSEVSLEKSVAYMVSNCDEDFSVGDYLVIESNGTNYLARIAASRIEDILSVAKAPVLSLEHELGMDVSYIPKLVALELIAECSNDKCAPPSRPPKIRSVVRVPREGEVAGMLMLPRDGITIGNLSLPNGKAVEGNYAKLPLSALNHHVLIVGTTGSGKTTLMKNMALELINNYPKATVISLDTIGHYHHLAMSGIDVRAIVPVTNSMIRRYLRGDAFRDRRGMIRRFTRGLVRDYLNRVFKSHGIRLSVSRIKVRGKTIGRTEVPLFIEVTSSGNAGRMTLIPWALGSRAILPRVNAVTGMLTEQASMFYSRILEQLKAKARPYSVNGIYAYLTSPSETQQSGRALLNYEDLARRMGIHPSTMENIVRTILAIKESGIVDVKLGRGSLELGVSEPNYARILSPGYVTADLSRASGVGQRMVVYRILSKVYNFMGPEHLGDRDRMAVIMVDEAHLFFPQAKSEEEKGVLEHHITRLTRLGRSRGIAVIFATHMPEDLNDAVLQLTNTKIVLRSEESVLERLGVKAEERRFLVTAEAGVAHVRSFAYRYPVYIKFSPNAYHVG